MKYTLTELADTLERHFTTNGVPSQAAKDSALVLATAEALGLRTHGVVRAAEYVRRMDVGGISRTEPEVAASSGPMSLVDAKNGVGPAAAMVAVRKVQKASEQFGMGMCLVRHSNHFGPAMPYSVLLAESGIASYVASNASPTMAAWGGTTPVIGNSPFGWGLPGGAHNSRPILVDMALSQVARAKIRQAKQQNSSIPSDWATDSRGAATTDPEAALSGLLLPVGAHKGYGLSIAVDFMTGVLSGSGYSTTVNSWSSEPSTASNLGHIVIGMNMDVVRQFTPDLDERIADFQQRLLVDRPLADVRLPGQSEYEKYLHSMTNRSIDVDEAVSEALN